MQHGGQCPKFGVIQLKRVRAVVDRARSLRTDGSGMKAFIWLCVVLVGAGRGWPGFESARRFRLG